MYGACMAVWMQAVLGNLDPGIADAAGWGWFPFDFFKILPSFKVILGSVL